MPFGELVSLAACLASIGFVEDYPPLGGTGTDGSGSSGPSGLGGSATSSTISITECTGGGPDIIGGGPTNGTDSGLGGPLSGGTETRGGGPGGPESGGIGTTTATQLGFGGTSCACLYGLEIQLPDVEWYLGVQGTEGATTTPGNMWFIDGGKSTGADLNHIPTPPWSATDIVRNNRDMTWSQMAALIDVTGGTSISPGTAQTLISTAVGTIKSVGLLGITLSSLGTDPLPDGALGSSPSKLLSVNPPWLLQSNNSIAIGMAKMRIDYRGGLKTAFDLVRVSGAYNGGGGPSSDVTDFGIATADAYVYQAAGRYNILVDYLSGSPSIAPSVRLKQ